MDSLLKLGSKKTIDISIADWSMGTIQIDQVYLIKLNMVKVTSEYKPLGHLFFIGH